MIFLGLHRFSQRVVKSLSDKLFRFRIDELMVLHLAKIGFAVAGLLTETDVEVEETQDEEDGNAALVAQRMDEIDKINQKVTRLEKQIGKMKAKDLVKILTANLAELENYEK